VKSLEDLTGVSFGNHRDRWQSWLRRNQKGGGPSKAPGKDPWADVPAVVKKDE
jgi:hypothetical protein